MDESISTKCRTCLRSQSNLLHLDEIVNSNTMGNTYRQILTILSNIMIRAEYEDRMPQGICERCCHQLQTADAFGKQARVANEKLWCLLDDLDENKFKSNDSLNCLQKAQPINIQLPSKEVISKPVQKKMDGNKYNHRKCKHTAHQENNRKRIAEPDNAGKVKETDEKRSKFYKEHLHVSTKHLNCLQEVPIDLPFCDKKPLNDFKDEQITRMEAVERNLSATNINRVEGNSEKLCNQFETTGMENSNLTESGNVRSDDDIVIITDDLQPMGVIIADDDPNRKSKEPQYSSSKPIESQNDNDHKQKGKTTLKLNNTCSTSTARTLKIKLCKLRKPRAIAHHCQQQNPSKNNITNEENFPQTSDMKKVNVVNCNDDDRLLPICCKDCGRVFDNAYLLSRHLLSTHVPEEQKVPCPCCNRRFSKRCNMYTHMRKFHGPNSVDVMHVKITKQDSKNLDQRRIYRCSQCPRRYTNKYKLNAHITHKHTANLVHSDCNNEGGDCVDKIDDNTPKNEESLGENNEKDNCSNGNLNNTYNNIINNMNNNQNNTKNNLNNPLNNSNNPSLKKPMKVGKVYNYRKRLLCTICGIALDSQSALTIHMRRHTGEKPFKCDLCNKAYPRMYDVRIHRRIHTGEKPYQCSVCQKAFQRSHKMKEHMRTHTNERPYKCSHCDKRFKQSKDLNIHKRSHTGERPYLCDVCGNTFTQTNSLKAHRVKFNHYQQSTTTTTGIEATSA